MKKSIASKIESLLAKMTNSESFSKQEKRTNKKKGKNLKQSKPLFCYIFPVTLFNLIRPAQQFDFK